MRLDAPITFVGFTALSVEMRRKRFAPILRRRFRDVQRAEHIILYRLGGGVLHQRHMLMRRSVEHKLRPVGVHDVENALAVAHGADEHDEIERRIAALQFLLDVVGVILVYVEDDQTARRRGPGDLAAQFAADAAEAAAGDEHGLAR